VPFAWVTADELYGQDTKFRLWLESRGLAHVVAVPKNAMVVSMELTKVRVDRVIADLDETRWQRLSCGNGTRGPRVSDWAVVDIRPLRDPRFGHWLLARRSITDPTDIAYYACFGAGRHDHGGIAPGGGRAMGDRRMLPGHQTWRRHSQERARVSHHTRNAHHNLSLSW
jgi:hypothetical protein